MSPEEFIAVNFDYVIIGGGAAGLLLAARLSENPEVVVGVLEAGGDHLENPIVKIPGLALQTYEHPDLDWTFKTVPQEECNGREVIWPRGKCLGGSSAINTMMFSQSSRRDLDAWAALGNDGWDWDTLQPYYRKYETYCPPDDDLRTAMHGEYIDPELHGTQGPIKTSFVESMSGWLEDVWFETAKKAGYPVHTDARKGTSIGAFNQLMAIDPETKERSYSASAFYQPNRQRPNLHVLTNAKASKLAFVEPDKQGAVNATGVSFSSNGSAFFAKTKREVILCAGAIQSPQLLELSGVGDQLLLDKMGIQTVIDNPAVGENLQDHGVTGVVYKAAKGVSTMEDSLRDEKLGEALLEMYQRDKSGPFAGGITATGFSSLSFADPELTDAQLERLIQDAKSFKSSATDRQLEVEFQSLRDPNEAIFQFIPFATGLAFGERGSLTKLFGHSVPGNWITSGAIATHVFSRGNIHIISTNPDDYPAIDPKYYSHPLDAELMGRAVMHLRQLCHTEPWASMLEDGPDGEKIPMPSPALAGPFNDPKTLDEAKTFVKQNTVTCYHPIGTCSMLPRDEGGVVGPDLKVYGTRNVRVVDASIFPLHVQGNIMSLVYAVAERAADIINGVSGQPKL